MVAGKIRPDGLPIERGGRAGFGRGHVEVVGHEGAIGHEVARHDQVTGHREVTGYEVAGYEVTGHREVTGHDQVTDYRATGHWATGRHTTGRHTTGRHTTGRHTTASGASGPALRHPERSSRRARAHRRRSRIRRTVGAMAAIAAVVALSTAVVARRIGEAVPGPTVTTVVHRQLVGSELPPALSWPSVGQGAVAVPGAGVLVQSAPEHPVPVASLTKIMTADIVLRDHPLAAGASGPTLTMGPVDVAEAAKDEADNDTSVPVQLGEKLTERQLLNGLMVHSANNFADTLARWDAGSISAFVAKMNAEAAALKMTATHYVDADGVHAGSVSTAADQLRLVAHAMEIPAFAAVVDQPVITEPLAGLLANYVQAVGTDGVVGVKSGFTQAAMGCVVLAADRTVGGRRVLVLAAVTGQTGYDALGVAQSVALRLVDQAAAALQVHVVVARGAVVGELHTAWGGRVPVAAVVAPKPVAMLEWPGTTVVRRVVARRGLGVPLAAGAPVGTLVVRDGTEQVEEQVRSSRHVTPAPTAWRLWR